MLQPRKRKYRKEFRGSMKGASTRGTKVSYGEYGLKAVSGGWVSSRQIESARTTITRFTKRAGRVYIRVFPHKPITKRAAGARMGGGKGDIDSYVAVVTPGRVMFEIAGVPKDLAKEAFRRAGHKLSLKTKFVER